MNRKRALAISCSVILLCAAIIVGMTWALFTDTKTVQTHLQAGTLDITLKRVGLTKTVLTTDGYLDQNKVIQSSTDEPVDFTNTSTFSPGKNVFGIKEDEVIVPGSKYTATMRIENHSSVAYGYWIEIVCSDPDLAGALATQVIVTVNNGTGKQVGQGLKVGDDQHFVGTLDSNKNPNVADDANSDIFTVTIEFIDESYEYNPVTGELISKNDLAQGKTLKFDLVVHAIQLTNKQ